MVQKQDDLGGGGLTAINQANSVIERVFLAVKHLATGADDVRSRLRGAGSTLAPLKANEFPPALQQEFKGIMDALTCRPGGPEQGSIDATMKKIRNSTGQKIAERIFSLYENLQEIRGRPLL